MQKTNKNKTNLQQKTTKKAILNNKKENKPATKDNTTGYLFLTGKDTQNTCNKRRNSKLFLTRKTTTKNPATNDNTAGYS